jgi:hypothetical protein
MKAVYCILAVLPLAVPCAAAQDDPVRLETVVQTQLRDLKQAKVMGIGGAVMGPAVKNAPYTAVEVAESTQVLGDGNRIHLQTETTVCRDSEGRVRRETPDQITIWDPVANVGYALDPKTQTARKLPLAKAFMATSAKNVAAVRMMTAGAGGFAVGDGPVPTPEGSQMVVNRVWLGRGGFGLGYQAGKSESLGQQVIEGVSAQGSRMHSTIPAGAIGNDRAIEIVSESWYSPDLQTTVKSLHSDPRMGEEAFQLTGISRVEPPSTLFQVPADYQIVSGK